MTTAVGLIVPAEVDKFTVPVKPNTEVTAIGTLTEPPGVVIATLPVLTANVGVAVPGQVTNVAIDCPTAGSP